MRNATQRVIDPALSLMAEVISLSGKASAALAHPLRSIALAQSSYYLELAAFKVRSLQNSN